MCFGAAGPRSSHDVTAILAWLEVSERPSRQRCAMRMIILVLPLLCAASALAEPGSVSRGRAFVKEHCSSCHAIGPTGRSPYKPAPPLRTLGDKHDVEGLAEAFAEGVIVGHKGKRQMPEFVLQPNEIDDLIAYLKWLRSKSRKHRP